MPENKTKATSDDVAAFVAAIADEEQRADAAALIALLSRLSGEPPVLWGKIIGFGRYHYRYESGREGDAPRIGFAPRKGQTVLYVMGGFPDHDALVAGLGKIRTGQSCVYIKRLADVDAGALERLAAASLAQMERDYPR
jgi:hypothetical protein